MTPLRVLIYSITMSKPKGEEGNITVIHIFQSINTALENFSQFDISVTGQCLDELWHLV